MKTSLVLAILAVVVVGEVLSDDCCIVTKINDSIKKAIVKFIDKVHHKTYCGCAKAVILGEANECEPKKFRLPQAPSCEKFVQHVDFESKCKKHNIKQFKELIENGIYSNGGDADEVCEKMDGDADKMIEKLHKMMNAGPEAMQKMYKDVCKGKTIEQCKEIEDMPEEMKEYLIGDFSDCFKNLLTILKNTCKAKGAPVIGATGQGIDLLFGGGEFGKLAKECSNQIITILTKFSKSISG